jgi:hypothetical protein
MRAALIAAVVTFGMAVGAAARGEEASPAAAGPAAPLPSQGFTFGLRAGWAKALGELAGEKDGSSARPFDKEFLNAFPVMVEGGYRLASGLTVGGYLMYGPAEVHGAAMNGGCGEYPTHCDAGRTTRLGLQLTYHLLRFTPFTPWIGAGTGYEWASFDVKDAEGSGTVTYKGWELANLQLGADWAIGPRFSVGPFASMSWARFSEVEIEGGGASVSLELADKRIHSWLQAGLRARFGP